MQLTLQENSYATVAEADAYFETRVGSTAWVEASLEQKTAALITATSELDSLPYIGQVVVASQPLAWPRRGVSYFSPSRGIVIEVSESELPKELKKATFEQAIHLITNEQVLNAQGSQTFESIKIGPIELKDSISDFRPTSGRSSAAKKSVSVFLVGGGNSGNLWWRAN